MECRTDGTNSACESEIFRSRKSVQLKRSSGFTERLVRDDILQGELLDRADLLVIGNKLNHLRALVII